MSRTTGMGLKMKLLWNGEIPCATYEPGDGDGSEDEASLEW